MSGIFSLAGKQIKDLKGVQTWRSPSTCTFGFGHIASWFHCTSIYGGVIKVDDAHFPVFCEPVDIKSQTNARKWEAAIGFKPTCTAPLQLLFMKPTLASKRVSKTDSSFGWLASHKTGLQSFRQTNVDLRQCWSPTMRKRHFQTFPNSSHLLLNLFDVHAFPLHHLPVWYAIFVWTKPYIHRVLQKFFRSSLNH